MEKVSFSDQAYAGNKDFFLKEYGGLPGRPWKYFTIILITIGIILIITIVVCILLLRQEPIVIFTDRNTLFNLDLLTDLNDGSVECCIFPGKTAPTRAYLYNPTLDITYSRDRPTNINVVCANFPDVNQCISENTDSEGTIIPTVTFEAIPYFVFEKGQFIGCPDTTTC